MSKGGKPRMKGEDFIAAAQKKHIGADGNPLYGYNLVDYVDSITPVNIDCRHHGVFTKTPAKHLHSQGCPKCSRIRGNQIRKLTKAEDNNDLEDIQSIKLQDLEDMSDYEDLLIQSGVSKQ